MMTQTNMRFDDETKSRVTELAARWSPVKPLTTSDVVRECVRRIYEAETETVDAFSDNCPPFKKGRRR